MFKNDLFLHIAATCSRKKYRFLSYCLILSARSRNIIRRSFLRFIIPITPRSLSPEHKSLVYYLMSFKDPLKAKDVLAKYCSKETTMGCIKLYEFFGALNVHAPETELLLVTAYVRALFDTNGVLIVLETLKHYFSDINKYLPALKKLKLYSSFSELYLRACRQVNDHEEYVRICEKLIYVRPMDWKNYFLLAIDASSRDDEEYLRQMKRATTASEKMSGHAYTLLVDAYIRRGDFDEAYKAFILGKRNHPSYKDIFLSAAALENNRSDYDEGFQWIRRYYESLALPFPSSSSTNKSFDACLRSLKFSLPEFSFPSVPKVSVIMTCYNSENFLDTSIESVLNQTYKNLELIIIDDNSEDRSVEKIRAWASKDGRIRLMEKNINEGTYVSKNRAILEAKGYFVTFCDSDDWMHPLRIEQHLKHTSHDRVMSYSNLVRITENFIPGVRLTGGFTHVNPSSMFICKKVFEHIGYFDSVRIGADSEFIWRTQHVYGENGIRRITLPLTLARLHEDSLTTSGIAAFDETHVSPVRLQYWDSWVKWHCGIKDSRELVVPFPYSSNRARPFDAPDEILVPYTDI